MGRVASGECEPAESGGDPVSGRGAGRKLARSLAQEMLNYLTEKGILGPDATGFLGRILAGHRGHLTGLLVDRLVAPHRTSLYCEPFRLPGGQPVPFPIYRGVLESALRGAIGKSSVTLPGQLSGNYSGVIDGRPYRVSFRPSAGGAGNVARIRFSAAPTVSRSTVSRSTVSRSTVAARR
ncbi:MAG: hypothetical protein AB1758_21785 [Candidatus Eremiobacterota bacterium]